MLRWQREYGPVFTLPVIGMGTGVWMCDPKPVEELCRGDQNDLRTGEAHAFMSIVLGANSLLVLDGPEHRRQRKLVMPHLKGGALANAQDITRDVCRREVGAWPIGEPLATVSRMQWVAFEVISRLVFGVTDPRRMRYLHTVLLGLINTNPLFWVSQTARRLPGTGFSRQRAAAFDAITEEVRMRRVERDLADRTDMLSLILRSTHDDGSRVTDEEARDQLLTMLAAGFDTTAGTMGFALELVYRNPLVLERLRASLDDGDESYLRAVTLEALRMRPSVPATSRRLTQPRRLGGWDLPAGTEVHLGTLAMQMRDDLFPCPAEFRPERFLGAGPAPYTYMPFGGGIRRCVGAALAELEISEIVRAAVSRVDLEMLRPPRAAQLHGFLLHPRHGAPARVLPAGRPFRDARRRPANARPPRAGALA